MILFICVDNSEKLKNKEYKILLKIKETVFKKVCRSPAQKNIQEVNDIKKKK